MNKIKKGNKSKRKFKINFNQVDYDFELGNKGFMIQWCCKCHSRHIWHFNIIRGKKPKDDYIEISMVRDFGAEKLRKFYEIFKE